jgi:hypothetical protein
MLKYHKFSMGDKFAFLKLPEVERRLLSQQKEMLDTSSTSDDEYTSFTGGHINKYSRDDLLKIRSAHTPVEWKVF